MERNRAFRGGSRSELRVGSPELSAEDASGGPGHEKRPPKSGPGPPGQPPEEVLPWSWPPCGESFIKSLLLSLNFP